MEEAIFVWDIIFLLDFIFAELERWCKNSIFYITKAELLSLLGTDMVHGLGNASCVIVSMLKCLIHLTLMSRTGHCYISYFFSPCSNAYLCILMHKYMEKQRNLCIFILQLDYISYMHPSRVHIQLG